jgi:hypothetical protein
MEDGKRKIVVFRHFETSIDANIVKTKLDAFDIPCFLTDENLANLYPNVGYHMMAFRVRLHLFEDDIDAANKILEESSLSLDENDLITHCPRCKSKKIEKDLSWNYVMGIGLAMLGIALPPKRVYRCLDCDNEFN